MAKSIRYSDYHRRLYTCIYPKNTRGYSLDDGGIKDTLEGATITTVSRSVVDGSMWAFHGYDRDGVDFCTLLH